MKATVITDASFCPDSKAAGWAVWVSPDNGGRIKKYGTFRRRPQHSAQAELWATLNGAYFAAKAGATDILLQTDCLQVVKSIHANKDLVYSVLRTAGIYAKPKISIFHVRGHTGSRWTGAKYWVQRWCDKYAGIAMREQRKTVVQ